MHRRAWVAASVGLTLVIAACVDGGGGATVADRATSTTAATTSTTLEVTTTSVAPDAQIELRGDGLGVTTFGAPPDEAVTAVTDVLGPPTLDTGWEASFSSYGTCPGERTRGVEWDHLVLLFTDGATDYGNGEHLFTWRITGAPPALGTAKGLGYRATVADAKELYPGAVEVAEPDDPFPGFVRVALEGGTITGYLDGDVITNLEAGAGCGE